MDGGIELAIYGEIGLSPWGDGVTASAVRQELESVGAGDTIRVRINSPGGDAFDGVAIHNLLREHKARVVVEIDGVALSAASIIAMAGDEIRMPSNALMMIHDPWTMAVGGADDLRDEADRLDKVTSALVNTYADRSGMDRERVRELMAAETWLTASEAVEFGLADIVLERAARSQIEPATIAARYTAAPIGRIAALVEIPAGPSPETGHTPQKEATTMKNVMNALGLREDASESAAVDQIKALKAAEACAKGVEELTGKVGAEAVGVVRALKAKADQCDVLDAKLAEQSAKACADEFAAAIADGEKARKLTPAVAKLYRSRFEASEDKAAVVADLRGFLEVAPQVVPQAAEVKEPTKGNEGSALTWGGKTFAQLKPIERHRLKSEDANLYNEMRNEAVAARAL